MANTDATLAQRPATSRLHSHGHQGRPAWKTLTSAAGGELSVSPYSVNGLLVRTDDACVPV